MIIVLHETFFVLTWEIIPELGHNFFIKIK